MISEIPATTEEHWLGRKKMPAKSKKQQRFMGMVHAAQQGEEPASPEVAEAAKNIDPEVAQEFAETKHEGLPERKRRRQGASRQHRKERTRHGGDLRRTG